VLPYRGGLFDQPGGVLLRMEKIRIADQVIEEAEENTATAKAEAEEKVAKLYGNES
jgi:hypothetical protein